jgi:hypothetical protein
MNFGLGVSCAVEALMAVRRPVSVLACMKPWSCVCNAVPADWTSHKGHIGQNCATFPSLWLLCLMLQQCHRAAACWACVLEAA